jgi:O-antigen/teichoic acid export membrane protein
MRALARRLEAWLGPSMVLTGGRLAAYAASFCIPLVLTRVFAPSDFGAYKQIFLVYYTIYFIAQSGMAESLFYFLPAAKSDGGAFAANSVIFLAAAGTASSLALVAFAGPVSRGLGNPAIAAYLPILGVFLTLTMASSVLEIVLISRARHLAASAAYGGSDLVKAACLLVPALITRDLRFVLAGAAAFAALRLAVTVGLLRRTYGRGLAPDTALLRRQLAYAAPFGAAVVIDAVQANYHQYAVSHRFDPATYAIYAVGCLQIPLVDFIAGPACNLMMVGMRERLQDGDTRAAARLWIETTERIAAFVLPTMVALLLTAHDLIVVLFTSTYEASVPVFAVWTLTMLAAVAQTDGVLRVFAETRFLFVLSVVKLAWVAGSVGALLTAAGLPGAAAASVGALLVSKVIALFRIRARLGVGVRELLPWRGLARIAGLASAAAVPCLLVRRALASPVADLAVEVGLYAVVYVALSQWRRIVPRAGRWAVPRLDSR